MVPTISSAFITDPTAPPTLATPLYSANLGAGTTAPLYTVPSALQRNGDLHELSLFAGPAANPASRISLPTGSAARLTPSIPN